MCLNSELILFPVSKQSSGQCNLTICHEIIHVCTNHDKDAQQVMWINILYLYSLQRSGRRPSAGRIGTYRRANNGAPREAPSESIQATCE